MNKKKMNKKDKETRPCELCSDPTLRAHDGTFSCFACRGFYRKNMKYLHRVVACRTGTCCRMTKEYKPCKGCRMTRGKKLGMQFKEHRRCPVPPRKLESSADSELEDLVNYEAEEHVITRSKSKLNKTQDSEAPNQKSIVSSHLEEDGLAPPQHKDSDAFKYPEGSSHSKNEVLSELPRDSEAFDNGTSSSSVASGAKSPQSTSSYHFNALDDTWEFSVDREFNELFPSLNEAQVTTPPITETYRTPERFTPDGTPPSTETYRTPEQLTPNGTDQNQYDLDYFNGKHLEDYNYDYSFDWMDKPQQEVEVVTEPTRNLVLFDLDGDTTVNAAPLEVNTSFGVNSTSQSHTLDTASEFDSQQNSSPYGFNHLTLNDTLEPSVDIETAERSYFVIEEHIILPPSTVVNKTQDSEVPKLQNTVSSNLNKDVLAPPLHQDSDALNYHEGLSHSVNELPTVLPLDAGTLDHGTSSDLALKAKSLTSDTVIKFTFPKVTSSNGFNELTLNDTVEPSDDSDIEVLRNTPSPIDFRALPRDGLFDKEDPFRQNLSSLWLDQKVLYSEEDSTSSCGFNENDTWEHSIDSEIEELFNSLTVQNATDRKEGSSQSMNPFSTELPLDSETFDYRTSLSAVASRSESPLSDSASQIVSPQSTDLFDFNEFLLNDNVEPSIGSEFDEFLNFFDEEHVTTPPGINETQEGSNQSMNKFSALLLDSETFDCGTSPSGMGPSSKSPTLDTSYDANELTVNSTSEFLNSSDIEEFFNSMTEEHLTTAPSTETYRTEEGPSYPMNETSTAFPRNSGTFDYGSSQKSNTNFKSPTIKVSANNRFTSYGKFKSQSKMNVYTGKQLKNPKSKQSVKRKTRRKRVKIVVVPIIKKVPSQSMNEFSTASPRNSGTCVCGASQESNMSFEYPSTSASSSNLFAPNGAVRSQSDMNVFSGNQQEDFNYSNSFDWTSKPQRKVKKTPRKKRVTKTIAKKTSRNPERFTPYDTVTNQYNMDNFHGEQLEDFNYDNSYEWMYPQQQVEVVTEPSQNLASLDKDEDYYFGNDEDNRGVSGSIPLLLNPADISLSDLPAQENP